MEGRHRHWPADALLRQWRRTWAEQRVPSGLPRCSSPSSRSGWCSGLGSALAANVHAPRSARHCRGTSLGSLVLVGFGIARRQWGSRRRRRDRFDTRVTRTWAVGPSSIDRRRPDSAAMSTGSDVGGQPALDLLGFHAGELAQAPRHADSAARLGRMDLSRHGWFVRRIHGVHLPDSAVSPAKASTYAYVNPLVAVFLGWGIAGESVTWANGSRGDDSAGVAMIRRSA